MCLHFLSSFSQSRRPGVGGVLGRRGMRLLGLRAHLGDLRISDLDILFVQSTQTGPMDSGTFSCGSYL